jgi:hypothetical protein
MLAAWRSKFACPIGLGIDWREALEPALKWKGANGLRVSLS